MFFFNIDIMNILMESEYNDKLIKNNLFKKINFEKYPNKFSFKIPKLLWYIIFFTIYVKIFLFIYLLYAFKRQKNDSKIIISIIKKY